jgi:thymidylate synthase
MEIVSGTTTDAWKVALKAILDNGDDFQDTNKRKCRELLNLLVEIRSPAADVTRPIEMLNGFNKWVYPPLDEIANIILTKKLSPVYTYSYGPSLFSFRKKINQIDDYVIPVLEKDPTSRRAVSILWDPQEDANPERKLVPSLCLIDFKLRNDRLNVFAFVRSNEMFFGWPANIYQIYTLQKYVAKKLAVKIGKLTTLSPSAHIFEDEFDAIRKVIGQL